VPPKNSVRSGSSVRRRADCKSDSPGSVAADRAVPKLELERAVWERVMRRLHVINRLLTAVLLALGVRMIVSGLSFASGLAAAIIAVLLVASLALTSHGRQLEPRSPLVVQDDRL
jgi:hypothetical protein